MSALYYSVIGRALLRVHARRKLTPTYRNAPGANSAKHRIASKIRNILIGGKGRAWVKVETGLAKGLWLHLNLVSEEKYWLGYHEWKVQEALQALTTPGTIAYDIGSHIGFFSIAMARLAGAAGRILAFEPDPESAERIHEHALRNDLTPRITLLGSAAWSYSSTTGIPFRRGSVKRDHGGVSADGHRPPLADGECISVPSITLDLLVEKGYPIPHIVKIDVEGGECEVLKGGRELFSQAKPKLICEIHSREVVNWLVDWLRQRGYVLQSLTSDEILPRIIFARHG